MTLDFTKDHDETAMRSCRFIDEISARQTKFRQLDLSAGHFPGMMAVGAKITGNLFMRLVQVSSCVDLAGAETGGQLVCSDGNFDNPGATALNAQSVRVMRGIFRGSQGETQFHAKGEVSLAGAKIGGQLVCKSACFEHNQPDGFALSAQGMKVADEFF